MNGTKRTRKTRSDSELTILPGIGPSLAADLNLLGVRSIRDLERRDPERLYDELCAKTGTRQDPCVLYAFRCAVYASRTAVPDERLMKWWNWKDVRLGGDGRPMPLPGRKGRLI